MKIEGFEKATYRIGDVDLFVRTAGLGAPVLLWHGFLETGLCWRHVADALAADHHVIVPDMRGYGGSSKPESGYDGRTLYEDFRGLIRKLGVTQPIHLIAHDMGAPPALLWAGEHPEEVATLTYVEEPLLTRAALAPVFAFERETYAVGGLWWWGLALATDAAERLIVGKERELLTWCYDTYMADRGAIPDALVDAYLDSFVGREGVAGALGCYRAVFDTIDQTEALARIDVPVLAVGGAKSLGDKVGAMLGDLCPRLTAEVVADSGHFVADEQPATLVERFRAFAEQSEHAHALS